MNYLKIFFGILLVLSATRFIPHPPNFTSLIALSFYIPVIFGTRFIPAVILSFALTDIFFGVHSLTFFTWGSVFFIGLISKYFFLNISRRLSGAFFGACVFYLLTNFGVWILSDFYEFSFSGLIKCYTLALPFFYNSIASTFVFSLIFEGLIKLNKIYKNYHKQLTS